jgi:integrase
VIEQFIARDQKPRNRGWRQVEQTLHKDLAPWLERPIRSITKRDVIRRLDAIVDSGRPIHANRVRSWTHRLFAWATERDILEASPAVGVRPPAREVSRDRVLEPDELAAVWHACTPLRWPWGPIVRLLMLTATRKGEVLWMRWQDLDLDQRLWLVPREFVKANRAHEIPLSDLALEIIADLPRIGSGPLVFPANRASSNNPVAGASYAKTRLDKISGVENWRLHDLRRTAASGMARLGHPPHVVAAILNHAPASTMGISSVYIRHRYGDEKRAALDAWAREIGRLIGRGEAARVVAIR